MSGKEKELDANCFSKEQDSNNKEEIKKELHGDEEVDAAKLYRSHGDIEGCVEYDKWKEIIHGGRDYFYSEDGKSVYHRDYYFHYGVKRYYDEDEEGTFYDEAEAVAEEQEGLGQGDGEVGAEEQEGHGPGDGEAQAGEEQGQVQGQGQEQEQNED